MKPKPVKYRGTRTQTMTIVEFQQVEGECWFALDPRLDLANHSPTGLEWGYRGSGPAQLAIAILATRLDPEEALQYYQTFKDLTVAALGGETWELDGDLVDRIIAELREGRDAAYDLAIDRATQRALAGKAS